MTDQSTTAQLEDAQWVHVQPHASSEVDAVQASLVKQMTSAFDNLGVKLQEGARKFQDSQSQFTHMNIEDFVGGYEEGDQTADTDNEEDTGNENASEQEGVEDEVDKDSENDPVYDSSTRQWLIQHTKEISALNDQVEGLQEVFKFNQARHGIAVVASKEELDSFITNETRDAVRKVSQSEDMKAFQEAADDAWIPLTADVAFSKSYDEDQRVTAIPVFKALSTNYSHLHSSCYTQGKDTQLQSWLERAPKLHQEVAIL